VSLLSNFFLNSAQNVVQYDCVEIAHPSFSQTYRLVRNATKGLPAVTHEGPSGPFAYTYFPMRIKPVGSTNDLTQSLSITIGDVQGVIQSEIALAQAANTMNTRPVCTFRCYRSDDLTQPIFGPLVLEISIITTSEEGNSFEAHAPKLNNNRTGEIYSLETFPMLSGFFF
jgi:uncharacterized protein DUF1833